MGRRAALVENNRSTGRSARGGRARRRACDADQGGGSIFWWLCALKYGADANPSSAKTSFRSRAHIQPWAPIPRSLIAMQTHLSPKWSETAEGKEAAAILRKCVHCGFCNATCPTYQLLGDELDGPRGRIYLIKQMLEGAEVTRSTQLHLDRCLTCLNCQTTCPSGVEYGHLVDIGRKLVEERVARPPVEKAVRWSLKKGLTSSWFAPALKIGQALRPLLPRILKNKVPARVGAPIVGTARGARPRKVLIL